MNAGRVAHVSVKLSGTVAELRKNIGDDVVKDEVLAVLESREVADALPNGRLSGLRRWPRSPSTTPRASPTAS